MQNLDQTFNRQPNENEASNYSRIVSTSTRSIQPGLTKNLSNEYARQKKKKKKKIMNWKKKLEKKKLRSIPSFKKSSNTKESSQNFSKHYRCVLVLKKGSRREMCGKELIFGEFPLGVHRTTPEGRPEVYFYSVAAYDSLYI